MNSADDEGLPDVICTAGMPSLHDRQTNLSELGSAPESDANVPPAVCGLKYLIALPVAAVADPEKAAPVRYLDTFESNSGSAALNRVKLRRLRYGSWC